jgi:hypothetical protein
MTKPFFRFKKSALGPFRRVLAPTRLGPGRRAKRLLRAKVIFAANVMVIRSFAELKKFRSFAALTKPSQRFAAHGEHQMIGVVGRQKGVAITPFF